MKKIFLMGIIQTFLECNLQITLLIFFFDKLITETQIQPKVFKLRCLIIHNLFGVDNDLFHNYL